jgi:hypothetical protein
MSIASEASSKAMNELASTMKQNMDEMQGMWKQTMTLQTNLVTMLAAAPPPRTRATRAARTAVNGIVPDSPQKIAFLLDHENVVTRTNDITPLLRNLSIKELWWVQQHVDDEKIKYNMKSRELCVYTENVWDYHCKQKAGMTVQARAPPRT